MTPTCHTTVRCMISTSTHILGVPTVLAHRELSGDFLPYTLKPPEATAIWRHINKI